MRKPKLEQSAHQFRRSDFPILASLRLDEEDWKAIAVQGFIAAERRRQRTYYKLRFRRDSRQHVRYVGGADQAAAVEAELEKLQRDVRRRRRIAVLRRSVTDMLRRTKQRLEPLLEPRGYYYHGQAVRKRRKLYNRIVDTRSVTLK